MVTQLIECKKIEFPKGQPGGRPFCKEFAEKLAITLKEEGMFNPVVVRPNPDKPGFYLGVQGRHRHYATMKVLKEQFIAARVFADMDEEDAEMARISENLWRNPLTKAQHVLALKRWYEIYVKKHGSQENGQAGLKAIQENREKEKGAQPVAEASEADTKPAAEAADEKPAPPNFTEMAAAATGQSETSIRRDIRVSKAFDEEQLEAFEQQKVSKADMQTIAKIKDKVRRDEVVSLIASGLEVEDALKEVMKDAAPAREDGKSKAVREAKAKAKEEKQPELTDDEWFDTYCGEKAAMFSDPSRFKIDAILYRRISEGRHLFRTTNKKHLAVGKELKPMNPLCYLVDRFISLSHPNRWYICEVCKGKGTDAARGVKCGKCFGGGYAITTEKYL